jgi:hypothetical protein
MFHMINPRRTSRPFFLGRLVYEAGANPIPATFWNHGPRGRWFFISPEVIDKEFSHRRRFSYESQTVKTCPESKASGVNGFPSDRRFHSSQERTGTQSANGWWVQGYSRTMGGAHRRRHPGPQYQLTRPEMLPGLENH